MFKPQSQPVRWLESFSLDPNMFGIVQQLVFPNIRHFHQESWYWPWKKFWKFWNSSRKIIFSNLTSETLAVTISASNDSKDKYNWKPSVLSTEVFFKMLLDYPINTLPFTIGTFPVTWAWIDWDPITSRAATEFSKTIAHFLQASIVMLFTFDVSKFELQTRSETDRF